MSQRTQLASLLPRETIIRTTGKVINDYLPFGSGLGSFAEVTRLYESPKTVNEDNFIHVQPDGFAEVALELRIPGVLLILLFLAWWAKAVFAVSPEGRGRALRPSSLHRVRGNPRAKPRRLPASMRQR